MESIISAQPPPCMAKHQSLEMADMQGMEFPMYVYKPRRGLKRGEDSKETYKLPHRLIEKKRRDRINECIAQLKDLLPEHLKLTTLGHLEKAVVLELTLKHVKSLSTLLEQQQQKIIALQNGLQIGDQSSISSETSEEMFRSGFHVCAKEVLQYLANQDSSRDHLTPSHMISHLHKVASEVFQDPPSPPRPVESIHKPAEVTEEPAGRLPKSNESHAKNFVSVIQRTYPQGHGEQSGSDTDTDSGYGGEPEKHDTKAQCAGYYGKEAELKLAAAERMVGGGIKQEGEEPRAKRLRANSSEDESSSGQVVSGHGSYVGFSQHQSPVCVPFYLIPQMSAAWPMLEKCWYPGGMPLLYPGMSASAASLSPEKQPQNLVMPPRAGSPAPHRTSMDSSALLQALKQAPPMNLESND
ncbi:class E basic helix-loop-helix protein 40 [Esox lucius]|uniref:Basic helix-loop-helix family, member e40 n=1 Tax=Esox lucius TaxID=8010 RepID=A0A3P8ZH82_ESOLU|nr:class E basic helix-loop-helix protein 40 [Esox lucius]